MDGDAWLVRGLERFHDLTRDWQRLVERYSYGNYCALSMLLVGESRSLDELHHQRANFVVSGFSLHHARLHE